MFYGIITSLFSALYILLYRRTCIASDSSGFSSTQTYFAFNFIALLLVFPTMYLLPASERIDFGMVFSSVWMVVAMLSIALMWLAIEMLGQIAMTREKVSVLLPYMETEAFFTILLGYFLLGEKVSTVTLTVAFVASIVLIIGNIDFRNFTFNRYCMIQILAGFIDGFANTLIAYTLLMVNSLTLIAFNQAVNSGLVLGVLLFSRQASGMMRKPWIRTTLGYMILCDIVWIGKYLLVLVITREYGIIIMSLLLMLQMVVTLALSYIFLHEYPSRRDIILATFIAVSVSIGAIAG